MVLACVEPGHIAKMNTSDALIIFARLPRPGEVKTRLGHSLGMERAAVTYREFAGHGLLEKDEAHHSEVRISCNRK